eukprot:GHVS01028803.1.p1 GENE.GHVS01028803.1~~GHVS01028803.1.p1  ORF type:complete len:434 (-),score=113.53 GHVS01028803.1:575-1876(-)
MTEQTTLVESRRGDVFIAKNAQNLYSKFLESSLEKKRCAFCTRAFAGAEDAETMRSYITGKLSQLPSTIALAKQKLGVAEERMSILQQTGEDAKAVPQLMAEIPEKLAELDDAQREGEDAMKEQAEEEEKVREMRHKITEMRELQRAITEWNKLKQKADSTSVHLSGLSSGIPEESFSQQIAEVVDEIRVLQQQLQTLDHSKDRLQAALAHIAELNTSHHAAFSSLQQQLLALQTQAGRCASLASSLRTKKEELSEASAAVPSQRETVERLATNMARAKQQLRERMALLNEEKVQLSAALTELQRASLEREELIKERNEGERNKREAEDARRRLKHLHEKRKTLNGELTTARTNIENIRKALEAKEEVERQLLKNIEMKKKQKQLDELTEQVEKLKRELGCRDPVELKECVRLKQEGLQNIISQMISGGITRP